MAQSQKRIVMVFIGQRNFYTEFLVDWLGQLSDLRGIVWTASDRHSRGYNLRRLRKRIKRIGFFKTLSEILYYIGNTKHRRKDKRDLMALIEQARKELPTNAKKFAAIEVPNLHSDRVHDFIKQCKCDVLLTQCINEIISESVFTIPRLGCFVYHEGTVPKYRGKFCTHWAIYRGEYDQIGASLIKVDKGLDMGKIAFVEHVLPEGTGRRHAWWEHEVLYLALPRLKKWIQDISAGRIDLIDQEGHYPIYSYPRFSHLFVIGKRVQEYERWRKKKQAGDNILPNQ